LGIVSPFSNRVTVVFQLVNNKLQALSYENRPVIYHITVLDDIIILINRRVIVILMNTLCV